MTQIPVSTLDPAQAQIVKKVPAQLIALGNELNALFPGRRQLVLSTILALALGENVFVYGRPGTAKTLYARTVLGALEGANIFQIVLNAQTPPSHLIGTQILQLLDQGVVDFNVENSLVSCDAALLDEIGNANPMTLTALNMILHERVFLHGTKVYPARLRFTIVSTNLEPSDFGTDMRIQANLDRFLFKVMVDDLKVRSDQLAMLNGSLLGRHGYTTRTRIKIEDLVAFQNVIRDMNFIGEPILLTAYLELVEKLETALKANYTDRSVTKFLQILEAIAFLDGQTEVLLDDLVGLEPAFSDGSNVETSIAFQEIAAEVIHKFQSQVGKQIDSAELALIAQLAAQVPSVTRQSTADELLVAYRKIVNIKTAMESIKPVLQPTMEKLDELETKVSAQEKKIAQYMRGI